MKLEIGKILKAQGINGEVKLGVSVDDAALLKGITRAYIDGREYEVKKVRTGGEFAFLLLDGVATRNDAEELRNKTVYADKQQIALKKERYFVDDLVGCDLVCGDENIGSVVDLLQYGAADVFVCKAADGKEFSFPFLKDVVAGVNVEAKIIYVEAKRFGEVVVYED